MLIVIILMTDPVRIVANAIGIDFHELIDLDHVIASIFIHEVLE